ncbi:hypothetical protein KIW84_076192 [Lathyrus oleraceus]|uniref:Uncharacterized protein n=1 Tax=Pisum sativum TaxID=3888 RepID=A0A9D5A324_PEA|nr:hypothetical protein KIW84_076192 [Pisum sativum]
MLDKHIADDTFSDLKLQDTRRPIKLLAVVLSWVFVVVSDSVKFLQWSSLLSSRKGVAFSTLDLAVVTGLMHKQENKVICIPVVVAVVSPFPPSDKIGINSVQREAEEIIPMKPMKMDWVPSIPLKDRDSQVERLKTEIFILRCTQRRSALKHLKLDRNASTACLISISHLRKMRLNRAPFVHLQQTIINITAIHKRLIDLISLPAIDAQAAAIGALYNLAEVNMDCRLKIASERWAIDRLLKVIKTPHPVPEVCRKAAMILESLVSEPQNRILLLAYENAFSEILFTDSKYSDTFARILYELTSRPSNKVATARGIWGM